MAVEKYKDSKGIVLFSIEKDADPSVSFIKFDTKEQFDDYFIVENNIILPKEGFNAEEDFEYHQMIIDGKHVELNIGELYIMVDGEIPK